MNERKQLKPEELVAWQANFGNYALELIQWPWNLRQVPITSTLARPQLILRSKSRLR